MPLETHRDIFAGAPETRGRRASRDVEQGRDLGDGHLFDLVENEDSAEIVVHAFEQTVDEGARSVDVVEARRWIDGRVDGRVVPRFATTARDATLVGRGVPTSGVEERALAAWDDVANALCEDDEGLLDDVVDIAGRDAEAADLAPEEIVVGVHGRADPPRGIERLRGGDDWARGGRRMILQHLGEECTRAGRGDHEIARGEVEWAKRSPQALAFGNEVAQTIARPGLRFQNTRSERSSCPRKATRGTA